MAHIERPGDPASRAFRRFREHGDPAALTEVFDRLGPELFALAAHVARDATEAEDLVQEVFLAALAGARRFDPSRAVAPWLVGILIKEARKARRGRARREGPRPEPSAPRDAEGDHAERAAPPHDAPLATVLSGEVRRAVASALDAVPARYREVLRPVLEDGVAPTALAATLGRAPGTVRAQLHRGLGLLRKALPHTLAPTLVGIAVIERSAGRGLAAVRAELAARATREGPRIALAGAGVLVTPSIPFLGVIVMQIKALVAVAATVLVGAALFVTREPVQRSYSGLGPPYGRPLEAAQLGAASATPDDPEPAPLAERSALAMSETAPVAVGARTRATATLLVRVVDEDGAGVARASVEAKPVTDPTGELRPQVGGGTEHLREFTGADGVVTLEVDAGSPLELRAGRAPDTSTGERSVAALAGGAQFEATIVVKTRPDLLLPGRVVDAVRGEPVAGVSVHLQYGSQTGSKAPKRPLPPRELPDAVTDLEGMFRVPAMSWRPCFVLCTGAGWSPRLAALIPPRAGAGASEALLTVALLRAATIEGTVTGALDPTLGLVEVASYDLFDDGQPRSQATSPFGAEYELEAAVDGGGRFIVASAPARAPLWLSLADAETREVLLAEPDDVELAPGANHAVTWALGSGGRFVCHVRTEAGQPAPDEELWLVTGDGVYAGNTQAHWSPTLRARTDALGCATFEGVQPGRWLVALAPESTARDTESVRYSVWATIPAHGAVVPVELTLYQGLYIRGTVRAPDGTPRATYVRADGEGLHASVQAHQCKGGLFRLGPLRPGRYAVEASGEVATRAGEAPLSNSSVVHVDAGATEVELRLGEGCDLVLAAVDRSSGVPVPVEFGCRRVGEAATTWSGGLLPTRTFSGRAPGLHAVLARTQDGQIGVGEVEVLAGGRTEFTLEVATGGWVRVRHSGSVGLLSASFVGPSPLESLGTAAAGPNDVALLLAPPGEYTLRLLVRDFDPASQVASTLRDERREVTVTAGGTVELEL